MPGPGPGNDEERLPWLEPYRAPAGKVVPAPKPGKRRAGAIVGGAAALAGALTAGYYVGQRERAPQQSPPVEVALAPVVAPPAAPPAPLVPAPVAPAPVAKAPPPVTAEQAPVGAKVAKASRKKPVRRAAAKRKIREAGIENARLRQVRAAQERRIVRRPTARRWPKMPSPGPAGQVIQLGAFKNPARANRAYQMRAARYPTLRSMPRVVVPVITKPRGQILYLLRLGTRSRQQSRIVCRNLRASGDHCLVIG